MIEAAAPFRPPVDHREAAAAVIGVAAGASVAGVGGHPAVKPGLLLDLRRQLGVTGEAKLRRVVPLLVVTGSALVEPLEGRVRLGQRAR